MRIVLSLFLMMCFFSESYAGYKEVGGRVDELFSKIKCPTCIAQSVKESDTRASRQIKAYVKREMLDGRSDDEILFKLQQAYGEDVIFNPAFSLLNSPLWILPFILFAFLVLRVRRYIKLN